MFPPFQLSSSDLQLIRLALEEDLKEGDVTTEALFSGDKNSFRKAYIITRQPICVAGLALAEETFRQFDSSLEVTLVANEGEKKETGDLLLTVSGKVRSILSSERVVLNFLQRLCGVATITNLFVRQVEGSGVQILDTRKTTPGWRNLEKQAVVRGGGFNHRFGLYDAFLIKDNHLAFYGSLSEAIQQVRSKNIKKLKIQVEVDTLEQLDEAFAVGVDYVLLDNMPLEDLRLAVMKKKELKLKVVLEASGRVNLQNVRAIAQTGVDAISIGALTHSVVAADLSLEVI